MEQQLYRLEILDRDQGWIPLTYRPGSLQQIQNLHSFYTGKWVHNFYRIKEVNK